MDSRDAVKRALAQVLGISLALGGPYRTSEMRPPRGKQKRGCLVGCHVCGKTWGTLYKDGDQKICGECRKKKESGQNGGESNG